MCAAITASSISAASSGYADGSGRPIGPGRGNVTSTVQVVRWLLPDQIGFTVGFVDCFLEFHWS